MANVALALDMTILGAPTQVAYQYQKVGNDGGSCFLVAPQKSTSSTKMTIKELVDDFSALWKTLSGKQTVPSGMPKVEDITAQLEGVQQPAKKPGSITEQITIQIKTIYLYIDTRGGKSIFEYALCCQVEQSIIPESIKAFNITSLTFAIWETPNKQILDMMGIVDLSKVEDVKALDGDKNSNKSDPKTKQE